MIDEMFEIPLRLALRFPRTTFVLALITAINMGYCGVRTELSPLFSGTPPVAAVAGDPFGGTCKPTVTQRYGPTDVVGEPIVNGVRTHTGIDLACPAGTAVFSVGAGRTRVGFDRGFGNNVVVESGGYFIRYAHLQAPAVQDGAGVQAGSLLGWEGSTGFSTGPHLHFEVDRGAPSVQDSIDPAPFLTEAA